MTRSTRPSDRPARVALLSSVSALACAACLFATEAKAIDVANQTDWNTAAAAVAAAGAGTTTTINITSGFTLSSSLAQLQASNANVVVNITGNGQAIDGASAFQGIQVNGANALTVNISNLSVANTKATGGNGQNGQNGFLSSGLSYGSGGGGGGGLGAGGGLLVGSGANVTLATVTFTGNAAQGGTGGNGGVAQNGASDPVNGGNGGAGGAANNGGAAGGGGAGGIGGHTGTQGTTGTAASAFGDGGGGGGGSGTTNSTAYTPNNNGGAGNSNGGNGAQGGDGVTNNNGSGGPGSDGGSGGNGGAGRGGAIYVATGGTLTILDTPISGATITGGSGGSAGTGQGPSNFNGSPGANGAGLGAAIYLSGVMANIGVSSGTVAYASTISGTGLTIGGVNTALNKTGAGTLVLGAANDFTGNVNITAGTVSIAGTGNLGNLANDVSIANGGTLAVTGTTTLAAARAFSIAGASTIDVASGTTTTLQGVVADGASSGNLFKSGAGTLILSATNTYTGSTNVAGGTLRPGTATSVPSGTALTVGSTATFDMNGFSGVFGSLAGAGTVTNGGGAAATLTAGGNGTDTTFSGVIQDGASAVSLTKTGAGTLTLSGTSTYTGATLLSAGNLIVNGSIVTSSGLTVAPGALVGGNGALPSTTINGTLSPGNSIGVITINGNLVFGAGSIYIVEVSPTSADRTNVTGTASLAGELRLIFGPGTYSSNSYTILSAAGGRSGTFNTTTTQGLPATLTASVTYTATDALLLVTLISQINPVVRTLAGTTPNQQAVAAAQDAAFNAGKPAITGLFGLSPAQLPPALDALSGEVHASTASVLVDESAYVRSAILGRLRQASYGGDASMASLSMGGPQVAFAGGELDSALAYAKSPMVTKAPLVAPVPSYDIVYWAQGFGAWGKFNSDGNAAALNRDLAGFITGFDGRFGNWRGGIAAGYTGSRNNTDGRGSANVDTGHIAAYGGWNVGAVNLRAGGAYAFHTIDTDRTIVFPGFFDRATAHYQGGTGQVFGEAGYGLAFGKLAVEPFAGGAWVRLDTDAFSERGGAAALNVAGNSFEVGYSTLGVRAASLIPLGDMVLVPRASAAWQHAFNDVTPDATVAFQNAGVAFTVAGVPIARDALLAEAGLDLAITPRATIGVSYTGQIASNVQDHAARGKFAWKF